MGQSREQGVVNPYRIAITTPTTTETLFPVPNASG